MALKYTTALDTLNEIAGTLRDLEKRLMQLKIDAAGIKAQADHLPTLYAQFAADLNAEIAANPGDAAWVDLANQLDKTADDFVSIAGSADDMNTAVDGVTI